MTEETNNISLTELAAAEIKDILIAENAKLDEKDIEASYLRVGVKGGGCSGFMYNLDLQHEKDESDEVFDSHGVKIICDPNSLLYLAGTVVDFKDEIMGKGFVFLNPNETSRCGCGSSFSA